MQSASSQRFHLFLIDERRIKHCNDPRDKENYINAAYRILWRTSTWNNNRFWRKTHDRWKFPQKQGLRTKKKIHTPVYSITPTGAVVDKRDISNLRQHACNFIISCCSSPLQFVSNKFKEQISVLVLFFIIIVNLKNVLSIYKW